MSHSGGDQTSNITVDITGNTASIATDFGTDGIGLSHAHINVVKPVWGDETESKRVTLTDPLPIQFAGQTETTTITGTINGGETGFFAIRNYGQDGSGSSTELHYIAVAGSTNGTDHVGITGQIQGFPGGNPVAVTGDIIVRGNGNIMQQSGIAVQGTSAGVTAEVQGEIYPGYGFGVPIAVTGGRRLGRFTDSIEVFGSVHNTGGRELGAATDSVSCYGFDQGEKVYTRIYASDGNTLGHSGDALNVAITNAGFSATVNVSSVHGVTNSSEPPLRIQGFTAGGGDPVTVRGENDGALEVTATSALSTTVSNTVTIDDDAIIDSLENSSKPLISTLDDVKTNTSAISSIRADINSCNVKATNSAINRPSDLRSGRKQVTTTTQQLHTNLEMRTGVTIKAMGNENVLVGNTGLLNSVENGYLLEPGESIFLEINNLNKIYVRAAGTAGSAEVYYIGT